LKKKSTLDGPDKSKITELKANESGVITVKLPLPPGTLLTLFNNDKGYIEKYLADFPGFYSTGDAGYKDINNYLFIGGRIDDDIKVSAHRLSTTDMEEVISKHSDIAECAVIGIADELKGQVPFAFVVLKAGITRNSNTILSEIYELVRKNVGPVASFKKGIIVEKLPKTRSGKIVRGTMRKMADGEDYVMPSTIDDSQTIFDIKKGLENFGFTVKAPTK